MFCNLKIIIIKVQVIIITIGLNSYICVVANNSKYCTYIYYLLVINTMGRSKWKVNFSSVS